MCIDDIEQLYKLKTTLNNFEKRNSYNSKFFLLCKTEIDTYIHSIRKCK